MSRSSRFAAILITGALAAPAAAHAERQLYGLDVRVEDVRVTERHCQGRSETTIVSDTYRISGSGQVPAGGGTLAVTTTRDDLRLADGQVVEHVRTPRGEEERRFKAVLRRRGGKLVVDARRVTPVNRRMTLRVPRRGKRIRFEAPDDERREEQPEDADGCTVVDVTATTLAGHLHRLR